MTRLWAWATWLRRALSWLASALVLIGVSIATLYAVTPITVWLEVSRITVEDAPVGRAPLLRVARVVHRPFVGEWSVNVRNRLTLKNACFGAGDTDYRPGNPLPAGGKLNLSWWVGRDCGASLPEGEFIMRTCWDVKPFAVLWPRRLCRDSNVFRVY